MDLFDAVRLDPAVARLVSAICANESSRLHSAEWLWGSAAYILAAHVWRCCDRPLLLVTAHGDEADDARDDFETAAAVTPELLPMLESFGGESEADADLAAARLALCLKLTDRKLVGQPPSAAAGNKGTREQGNNGTRRVRAHAARDCGG